MLYTISPIFLAIAQKPTPTPRPIPPPTDPFNLELLIFFCVLIVVIILGGVWFNRWRIEKG